MSNLRLAVVVDAIDNLTAPFRRMTQAVAGPARAAREAFATVNEHLRKFSESYAGLAASIGAGFELREVIKDDDFFDRIGIDAGVATERVDQLKSHMFGAAEKWGVSLSELEPAFRNMFDLVGLDKAEGGIDALAMSIQRLGGNGVGPQLGLLFADLEKFGNLKGPDDLIKAMAILRDQVGPHSTWLVDFARIAPEVMNAYKMQGTTGLDAMRDLGAAFSTLRASSPSPREAGSALMELLLAVYNPKTAASLAGLDIPTLGATRQEREQNLETMRRAPIPQWLPQLVEKLRAPNISLMLDGVVPGLQQQLVNFDPAELRQKLKVTGDTKKFADEAAKGAKTMASALSSIGVSIQQVADIYLSSPLKLLADLLTSFPRVVGGAVLSLGGLAVLGLVGGWVGQALGMLRPFLSLIQWGVPWIVRLAAMVAGPLVDAFAAFDAVMLLNPIGLVIAAVAGLAAVSYELYEHWDKIVEIWRKLPSLWGHIKQMLPPALGGAKDRSGWTFDQFGNQLPAVPGLGSASPIELKPAPATKNSITIRFENAPKGMRVTKKESGPGTELDLDTGYGMALP